MTRQHRILAALMFAGALAAGGAAQAQGPQGGGPQQPDMSALLHLSPDQMSAFHAYQAATRPSPDQLAQLRANSPQALASLPTPQRLDRVGMVMTLRMQMFQHVSDATRAFYGVLSPQQQQTFDHLTAPAQRGGPQG